MKDKWLARQPAVAGHWSSTSPAKGGEHTRPLPVPVPLTSVGVSR